MSENSTKRREDEESLPPWGSSPLSKGRLPWDPPESSEEPPLPDEALALEDPSFSKELPPLEEAPELPEPPLPEEPPNFESSPLPSEDAPPSISVNTLPSPTAAASPSYSSGIRRSVSGAESRLDSEGAQEREPVNGSGKVFLGGASAILLGAFLFLIAILRLVEFKLPLLFLAFATVIALGALLLLRQEASKGLTTVRSNEGPLARRLARQGATSADSLQLVRQTRQSALDAFNERGSTAANILIMLGMIATASYLVIHAGEFAQTENLAGALPKLLALAPKSFAATALALWYAVVLSICSNFVGWKYEMSPEDTAFLVEEWSQGQTSLRNEDVRLVVDSMATLVDERILSKLAELPAFLDEASRNASTTMMQMQEVASTFTKSMSEAGHSVLTAAEAASKHFSKSHEVMESFQSLSERSLSVGERLEETHRKLGASTEEGIEKIKAALEVLNTQIERNIEVLVSEVGRAAPEIVRSSLDQATQAFAMQIRSLGGEIENKIYKIGLDSFGNASKHFETTVSDSNHNVERLKNNVVEIDQALRSLGGIIDAASATWDPHVEKTTGSLHSLSAAFERLSQESGRPSEGLDRACQAIEDAGRRLGEATEAISQLATSSASSAQLSKAQAEALSKIAGILRSAS